MRMCPVCDREWHGHWPWHRSDRRPWDDADWFGEICGSCAQTYKRWAWRFGDDLEPEKTFLNWILKKYNADIKGVESGQGARQYCKHQDRKGRWCHCTAKRDGYCFNHCKWTPEEIAERQRWREQEEREEAQYEAEEKAWRHNIEDALYEAVRRFEVVSLVNAECEHDCRAIRVYLDEVEEHVARLRREMAMEPPDEDEGLADGLGSARF